MAANGDVDWLTLGRFDAAPLLFPLLDAGLGGGWSIRVAGATVTRSYEAASNILRTLHDGPEGILEVLDFLPVGRRADAGTYDYDRSRSTEGEPNGESRFRFPEPPLSSAQYGSRTLKL